MESDKTLLDLGWPTIVRAWASRCRTERGGAAVEAMRPCASQREAGVRIAEVSEARQLEDRAQPMSFGGISDVRVAVVRAHKGSSLEAEELVAIADSARGYFRLRDQLEAQQESVPLLWRRAEEIADFEDLYATLHRAFEPDGRLADSASPTLGALRRKVLRLQQALESKAKAMLEDSRIVAELQDTYWTQREDRYVLPVRASSRSKVPGIVHGSSGSGQTVFVEPHALVEMNNELKLAEYEQREEELRILAALSALVGESAEELKRAAELVVGLDVIGGAGTLSNHLRARAPIFVETGRTIDLRRVRHPLMLLAEKDCVPNDIVVEEGRLLIISGPNAGGKTVALKSVGLAILMSRYGLHIPAGEGSSIPWFSEVLSAIGDSQSLESELSTFSAHLVLLREFLAGAGERSLVLIDEICSATEPEQGGALAQAVLESLAQRGVTALVTTHYERLKALATENERFANASVGFDLERMAPTFRMHLGVPGASAAIDVARRMGLPESINARAEELSGGGRAKIDELLRVVSDERERLIDERQALEEERAATARAYEETRRAQIQAEEAARKQHEKDYQGAMSALRAVRSELEQAKSAIKKRTIVDGGALRAANRKVDALAGTLSKNAPRKPAPPGSAPDISQLSPGTEVLVASMGAKGVVVEPPKKGKVLVQMGLIKSKIDVEELRLVKGGGGKGGAKKAASGAGTRGGTSYQLSMSADDEGALVRSVDATLDLRGARADEAIASVDRFIDASLLSAREAVFIVHGHGTGALRTAVRGHLETHACVSKWRKGQAREGGDGVTVAWLDH